MMRRLTEQPVLIFVIVLTLATALGVVFGMQVSRITEIAIYTLYGAGVNLLIGYTGLVPFGASVFFGLASYAAALTALRLLGLEVAGLAVATVFSLALGAVLGAVILRRRGLYFSLL